MQPHIQRLIEWLHIDSISGNEREFLETLESHFTERGFRCERQDVAENRWNLAVLPADPKVKARFLYSTHVDVVPPLLPVRLEAGTVYGRGSCDTKGGIIAMDEAGERLRAAGHENFGYLFVVGEEVDHIGARTSRSLEHLSCERIILCEPTLNRVALAQKGMVRFELKAKGIAGHSAYPERGESAVDKLLEVLEWLRTKTWPSDPTLGEATTNIGVIEGGVAANVFAPSARAEVLMRAVSPVGPTIEAIRAKCAECGVEGDFTASNDPVFYDPPEGVPSLVVSFNTDATYLTELAPVWLVGPGDIEVAHGVNEHITIASLADGIDLYERLGKLVLDSDPK